MIIRFERVFFIIIHFWFTDRDRRRDLDLLVETSSQVDQALALLDSNHRYRLIPIHLVTQGGRSDDIAALPSCFDSGKTATHSRCQFQVTHTRRLIRPVQYMKATGGRRMNAQPCPEQGINLADRFEQACIDPRPVLHINIDRLQVAAHRAADDGYSAGSMFFHPMPYLFLAHPSLLKLLPLPIRRLRWFSILLPVAYRDQRY